MALHMHSARLTCSVKLRVVSRMTNEAVLRSPFAHASGVQYANVLSVWHLLSSFGCAVALEAARAMARAAASLIMTPNVMAGRRAGGVGGGWCQRVDFLAREAKYTHVQAI